MGWNLRGLEVGSEKGFGLPLNTDVLNIDLVTLVSLLIGKGT